MSITYDADKLNIITLGDGKQAVDYDGWNIGFIGPADHGLFQGHWWNTSGLTDRKVNTRHHATVEDVAEELLQMYATRVKKAMAEAKNPCCDCHAGKCHCDELGAVCICRQLTQAEHAKSIRAHWPSKARAERSARTREHDLGSEGLGLVGSEERFL